MDEVGKRGIIDFKGFLKSVANQAQTSNAKKAFETFDKVRERLLIPLF